MTYRCTAPLSVKLESDATSDDQIIDLAEAISLSRWGTQLDSPDLGDSMGALIRAGMEDHWAGELNLLYMGDGFYVQIIIDFDLFKWDA